MGAFTIRLRGVESAIQTDGFEANVVAEELVLQGESFQILGREGMPQTDRSILVIQEEHAAGMAVLGGVFVDATVEQAQVNGVLVSLDGKLVDLPIERRYRDSVVTSEFDKSICFCTSSLAGSRPQTLLSARRIRSACGTGCGAE